jgi:NADH:ubiquinone oxidoreductase subunit E/NAD-dependent dihydropyrimidine dehydrogenase PreA subunit
MLGMFKAMRTTLSHLPKRKITVQYPEQREHLPERSRGLFRVVIDPAGGDPRCRSCTLCESNCPVQVIRVNATSKYALPLPNAARIAAARTGAQQGVDLGALQPVLDDYYEHGTGLISMLQNTQEVYGYLPRAAIDEVSLQTGVSLSQIYGVATFYNQFRLQQAGKFIINVCQGTACHVAGASLIADALSEELGLSVGETSHDRLFTLQTVSCVGACALAPVVRVNDDETHGKATPDSMRKLVADLKHRAEVDR